MRVVGLAEVSAAGFASVELIHWAVIAASAVSDIDVDTSVTEVKSDASVSVSSS